MIDASHDMTTYEKGSAAGYAEKELVNLKSKLV
jgi:hypothetical protein